MAVSANALSLAQYAVMSNDPLVQAVSFSLIDNGSILQDIPLVNKATLIANGVRWEGSLPTVNWGQLNSDPIVTSGTPKPYQEQAYIVRNAIDVDRFLIQDENQIVDPRAAQVEAYLRSVAYDINDKFINNDHVAGDANAPVGLKFRINNGGTYGVRSENFIDAGGVNLSVAGITASTANSFLEFLDQLLWSVDAEDGQNCVLYMSDIMKRRFATAARIAGPGAGFQTITDAYDRRITTYRNAIVRDIGRKSDQTTKIITNTETLTGAAGASTMTSIYAVHYDENHLLGWQFSPLVAQDINLIGNGGTVYRTLVDYAFGLYNTHTRSMARLYDIKTS